MAYLIGQKISEAHEPRKAQQAARPDEGRPSSRWPFPFCSHTHPAPGAPGPPRMRLHAQKPARHCVQKDSSHGLTCDQLTPNNGYLRLALPRGSSKPVSCTPVAPATRSPHWLLLHQTTSRHPSHSRLAFPSNVHTSLHHQLPLPLSSTQLQLSSATTMHIQWLQSFPR